MRIYISLPISGLSLERCRRRAEQMKAAVTGKGHECITPYDAVLEYVGKNVMPLEGWNVVRPFYPGGDYERFDYRDNSVVIDNPPFSILSKIVGFYLFHGVKFWLFAPSLTLFHYGRRKGVTCVCAHADVTYENGAVVKTSFLTNMYPEDYAFTMDGDLCRIVAEASLANQRQRKPKKEVEKKAYPGCLVTSALLGKVVQHYDEVWKVPRESCVFVSELDRGTKGKGIFGGGFLLSEKAAAEKAAAVRIDLSEREELIISRLK